MAADEIKITILEDGTIRIETDQVGQANHTSADKLLEQMARLAGGQTETVRKSNTHTHHHHGVAHSH
jgi:hypothetical protein